MRPISAGLSIGFSLALGACMTLPQASSPSLVCTLRPIPVSDATRAHLRAPLEADEPLPEGYGDFVRALAAHNAKMQRHCPSPV